MISRRKTRRTVVLLLVNLAVAAAIVEIIFVVTMTAPRLSGAMPRPVRRLFQQVYRHFDRSIIQFEPDCARYDPELTYTLAPGSCTFENVEFSARLTINRLGLRDDEASLEAPEVIVLGDSQTMGWGVQQDETFSRILARKTGLKVLNAGISSYGTAREMKLLDRLDTSGLKTLIIQYSDTDAMENWIFREHGGGLLIMSEADYQRAVRRYLAQQGYYPGKYIHRLFMKLTGLEPEEPNVTSMPAAPEVSPVEEAELFLNVLARGSRRPLDGVQIIVFEINEQIRPPRPFVANVAIVSRRDGNPPFIRQLRPLDVAPLLEESDFYTLDDHMRPHGHEVVGSALADLIR
jgi:hypothetical protein